MIAVLSGAADGEIVGWLPLEVADFVSEFFKKPAALWHMVYHNESVGEVRERQSLGTSCCGGASVGACSRY